MFTSENEGTVILNETDKEKYKFGLHDEFMEEEFDSKDAKKLGESQFGSYSGFAQQYLFYYSRENDNVW